MAGRETMHAAVEQAEKAAVEQRAAEKAAEETKAAQDKAEKEAAIEAENAVREQQEAQAAAQRARKEAEEAAARNDFVAEKLDHIGVGMCLDALQCCCLTPRV